MRRRHPRGRRRAVDATSHVARARKLIPAQPRAPGPWPRSRAHARRRARRRAGVPGPQAALRVQHPPRDRRRWRRAVAHDVGAPRGRRSAGSRAFFPRPAAPLPEVRQVAILPGGWIEDVTFRARTGRPGHGRQLARDFPANQTARRAGIGTGPRAASPSCACTPGAPVPARSPTPYSGRRACMPVASTCVCTSSLSRSKAPRRARLLEILHPTADVTRANEAFLQTVWEAARSSPGTPRWPAAAGGSSA